MFDENAAQLLKEKGYTLGAATLRAQDGMVLIRINDVLMFYRDADDLAHDRATIEQIVGRNEGKVLPDAPR